MVSEKKSENTFHQCLSIALKKSKKKVWGEGRGRRKKETPEGRKRKKEIKQAVY